MQWCGADIIMPGEGRMAGPGAIARARVEWPRCGHMAEPGLDWTLHGLCHPRGMHQDPVPPMPEPAPRHAVLSRTETEERSATLVFGNVPRRPHRLFQSHPDNLILHDTDITAYQHLTYMVTDITTSIGLVVWSGTMYYLNPVAGSSRDYPADSF